MPCAYLPGASPISPAELARGLPLAIAAPAPHPAGELVGPILHPEMVGTTPGELLSTAKAVPICQVATTGLPANRSAIVPVESIDAHLELRRGRRRPRRDKTWPALCERGDLALPVHFGDITQR